MVPGAQIKVEEGIQQREVHAKMMEAGEKEGHLGRTLSTVKLAVDAQRADAMDGEGGLAETLRQIVAVTSPSPRFLKYFEHHLQRHLSLLGAYPPRWAACCELRHPLYHIGFHHHHHHHHHHHQYTSFLLRVDVPLQCFCRTCASRCAAPMPSAPALGLM